ncbi:MAG: MipA/OmpV family protein [Rhizobacter sp.]|nr:MipA/OmpV family protein [Rhizobacter sp.]
MKMLTSAAALTCAALAPIAQAQDGPPPGWVGPAPGWSGGVLLGAAAVPEYEGSRHTRVQPVLGGEVYWRPGAGASVAMGSRGLVWTPWQTTAGSASLGLSVDPGRVDDDERKLTPAGLRPGSADLRGMGEVKMTALVSASGSLVLGPVSLTGAVRQAVSSHRGTLVEAGLALPWQLHRHAKLTLTPGVTWADRRHMQAYFGVTPQQSAASGFAFFDAGAGLKSQQLVLDFDMAFSRHWHVNALLRVQRLAGDAADSPLTQRTRQASGMLALRYEFQL